MRISDWSSDVCSSDLYLSLGDEKYLTAVTNAFRMIQEQSWASGGWGPGEFFIKPGSGELAETLFRNFKRSEEHTSELQSLMRISYAVFCLKKKNCYALWSARFPRHARRQLTSNVT